MWGGRGEGVHGCEVGLFFFCVCVCARARASAHVVCKCLHADMHMLMHSYQCVRAEVVTVQSNVTVSMLTLLTALHAILSERKNGQT